MAQVGFIGAGAMGAPMARHLLAAGHDLAVFARRRTAVADLEQQGARYAASPADAAGNADFIFVSVTSTGDVQDVLLGERDYAGQAVADTAPEGAVVCDTSTIDAGATRRMAARLAERGIAMLDCPVSGGAAGAEAATLTLLVGGEADVLARARPLLECLGKQIFHMGGAGAGQITKACNQIAQVVNIQGIAEAMLFARSQGVDPHKVVDALMSGFAGSKMLGLMGPKMASRDFEAGIEARLHHKDLGLIVEMIGAADLSMPATELTFGQLEKLMRRGWGSMDTCNLLRVIESDELPDGEDVDAG